MAKKFYKNEKFQEFFYPIVYILMTIAFVISGLVIFYSCYFSTIVVSGSSMQPTLLGAYTTDRANYGIADKHDRAIDGLKRFDVVITHYPSSWISKDEDTTYKIKRVWGFPGEELRLSHTDDEYTFAVVRGELIVEEYKAPISLKNYDFDGVEQPLRVATFTVNDKHGNFVKTFDVNVGDVGFRTLGTGEMILDKDNQEYFLMGDNWVSSSDSYFYKASNERITRKLLQGKVVCIQGTAIYDSNTERLTKKKRLKDKYYF